MRSATVSVFLTGLSLSLASCVAPPQQGNGNQTGDVYQDPNNPYAVPGVSTQGGGFATTPQAPYQNPAGSAPYQPIPSTPVNPPATISDYTPPAASSPASGSSSSAGGHTVASGDTLWGLSRKYGVSVDELRQANGITNDIIVPGQTLNIPR